MPNARSKARVISGVKKVIHFHMLQFNVNMNLLRMHAVFFSFVIKNMSVHDPDG